MYPQEKKQTLVILKPDTFERGLEDLIFAEYLRAGFAIEEIRALNFVQDRLRESFWREFYDEHAAQPYFGTLVDFMASGPALALRVVGFDAVAGVRALHGGVKKEDQPPGSIRNLYMKDGDPLYKNLVHASDSDESAKRELSLVFDRH